MIHLPKPSVSGWVKSPIKALVTCLPSYILNSTIAPRQKLKTVPSKCQNADNYYIDLLHELKVLSTLNKRVNEIWYQLAISYHGKKLLEDFKYTYLSKAIFICLT